MMSLFELAWILGCVVLVSAFGLWRFVHIAPRVGLMDQPNQRSQHTSATVVGAGVVPAITFAVSLWLWVPSSQGVTLPMGVFAVLIVALAVLGLLDDRFNLPSAPRLLAYFLACGWVVYLGLPGIPVVLALVLVVFFTWHVNAFNFMDGLDGLAATQALVVAWGMGVVGYYLPVASPVLPWVCALLVAALLPLWVLNWPPARVFMGDSGAVSVGLALTLIAVLAWREDLTLFAVWWILMAPFLTDTSATLLIRLMQGKAPHVAHREHAYQRLAQRTGSALQVNVALLVMHLLWQVPLVFWTLASADVLWMPVILAPIPTLIAVAHLQRSAYTSRLG